jgi:hypothetical protein
VRPASDYKKLLFVHMRKAGGSTARAVLAPLCRSLGVEFKALEGSPLHHDHLDDDTFLVTNFRHPVERICSLYNNHGLMQEKQAKGNFTPFDDWLDQKLDSVQPVVKQPLWIQSSDYHVRILCDLPGNWRSREQIRYRELTQNDYHNAILSLQRVNLFLMTEWLQNEKYRNYLSSRLLGEGRGKVEFGHNNQTSRKHNFDIRRTLTQKQKQKIVAMNRWDLELYRYVCWREAGAVGMKLSTDFTS